MRAVWKTASHDARYFCHFCKSLRPRSNRLFELPYSFFFRPGGGIGKPADAMNATKPDRSTPKPLLFSENACPSRSYDCCV